MKRIFVIGYLYLAIAACNTDSKNSKTNDSGKTGWDIAIVPASVRVDPLTGEILENRFKGVEGKQATYQQEKNWVYDGNKAVLFSARGEYVSFQVTLNNYTDSILRDISIAMPLLRNQQMEIKYKPEIFLEWAVHVQTPSTGYAKASLGKGWYPDALIPLENIQYDSSKVHGRWIYPLWLPDFNNRIEGQRTLVFWVDQFIPFDADQAKAGVYTSEVAVTVDGQTKKIPIELNLWNFAIPNENKLKASLQEEGYLSGRDEKSELEIYQLFKKNRVGLMDPTYQPELLSQKGEKVKIGWDTFDKRLKKYFTGEAFTEKYGYEYGPGYGEPLETFMLPFDVYGKHDTPGWPDIGKPGEERNEKNSSVYIDAIRQVRSHLQPMINPAKTDITVYLNGLDESYFKEALDRMVYFGNMFKRYYPETNFRIDGGYNDSAMEHVHKSITAWASHTINYDIDRIKKYQEMGIKDWLYGPLLYEGKVNSWVGSCTFTDLPLLNDRAISWAIWKYHTYSWISWGIGVGGKSGWYDPETWKDVYKHGADSDPEFTYKKINGSALMVYEPGIIPNVSRYCPSIRLKAMRNGVQEYEYMRLLADADKSRIRTDSIVNTIIKHPFGESSIGNLDVWSYNAEEWDNRRISMGKMIDQAK
ncbi:MAG: DUF4091 domain-containing protein [Chitinophagaceae bacterium]|nr:DUF4091 domain-containing protein [Chitinophagaceae bacterium]